VVWAKFGAVVIGVGGVGVWEGGYVVKGVLEKDKKWELEGHVER